MVRKVLAGGVFLLASSVMDATAPPLRGYTLDATLIEWTEPTCWPPAFITPEDIDEVLRHEAMESACGDDGSRFHATCLDIVKRLEPACDGSPWCRRMLAEKGAIAVPMHGRLCPAPQWEEADGSITYCDD